MRLRGFVGGRIPGGQGFAEFKRVLREYSLFGHIGPTSSHPDPPGRISPAAPMVLVRLGVRESRACPDWSGSPPHYYMALGVIQGLLSFIGCREGMERVWG
ncbi:hypothetical protein [Lunatimonas salinarum]|uniref:hypothetical protein n=1 Tax=Lunatimonas salinarum TaxID=1774590 RepID=UPI001ADEC347|nr:hypothetical protein [Lunatimonas salinarum]